MRAFLRGERQEPYQIVVEGEGFTVLKNGQSRGGARWEEIVEIIAFKRDLLTTDLICFDFRLITPDLWIGVDEDIPGFEALDAALQQALPGYDALWRQKVTAPAFAPNVTTIYRKTG